MINWRWKITLKDGTILEDKKWHFIKRDENGIWLIYEMIEKEYISKELKGKFLFRRIVEKTKRKRDNELVCMINSDQILRADIIYDREVIYDVECKMGDGTVHHVRVNDTN